MELLLFATSVLILTIIFLVTYDYYLHHNRRGKLVDKIPGPKFYPVVGNGLDVNVPYEQLWHFFRKSARDYYPVYKFWAFHSPFVSVSHPDDLEILLSSNKLIEKSPLYDLGRCWVNDGLLTSKGDKWRSRRKILTPAFHFNVLEEFVDAFVEHTNRLVADLLIEAESGYVIKDVLPIISEYTLATICETAMGSAFDKHDESQKDYRKAVHDIGNMFYWRALKPWLKNDTIYSLTKNGKEQIKVLKRLHGFTTRLIAERQQYHDSTGGKYLNEFSAGQEKADEDGTSKRKRLAFLDLLIAASRKGLGVDDVGIREEVDTFVFEGHDTTAAALFFLALLLAEHEDIQHRCREEVRAVMLERVDEKMGIRDLQKMNYLERCIKESLRLYPSVPTIARRVSEDIQLKTCLVPKDSLLMLQLYDTHRDPIHWPRPNIYDPDRFLPENMKGRHPFAYVPFSAGPRNCIGQKFAMLEMKTLISGILLNFHLVPMELAAHVRMVPDVVLRTPHQVPIKFVPIKK